MVPVPARLLAPPGKHRHSIVDEPHSLDVGQVILSFLLLGSGVGPCISGHRGCRFRSQSAGLEYAIIGLKKKRVQTLSCGASKGTGTSIQAELMSR